MELMELKKNVHKNQNEISFMCMFSLCVTNDTCTLISILLKISTFRDTNNINEICQIYPSITNF